MNHNVPEGLFVEVKVVGHKNHHMTFLDRLVLFSPTILETPQLTTSVHEAKLGRTQLVAKILLVALPEHLGHGVVISYHFINFLFDGAKLAIKSLSHWKFIGIGTISSQRFFVYLTSSKILALEKAQIHLAFHSFMRIFAP